MSRRKRSRNNEHTVSMSSRMTQMTALFVGTLALWYCGGREFVSSCYRLQSCCANAHFPQHPSDFVAASYNRTDFSMAVRAGAPHDYDLVSTALRASGGYSVSITNELISTLRRLGPRSMFIDVGAGLGWHTLTAAYAGHRVIAFEPYNENVALLNASLCVAPRSVRENVRVLNYALGAIPADGAQCELWQQPLGDRGAPLTICGTGDAAAVPLAALKRAGYSALAHARIRALDELIATRQLVFEDDTALVLRIDAGGWEPMALEGARELLRSLKPEVIFATFAPREIQRAALTTGSTTREGRWKPAEYLRFMQDNGYEYKLRTRAFNATQQVVFRRRTEPEPILQQVEQQQQQQQPISVT